MLMGLAISVAAMALIPFADLVPDAIRGGWLAIGNILVALGTATFHVTDNALPDGVDQSGGAEAGVLDKVGSVLLRGVCGKHLGRTGTVVDRARNIHVARRRTAISLLPFLGEAFCLSVPFGQCQKPVNFESILMQRPAARITHFHSASWQYSV